MNNCRACGGEVRLRAMRLTVNRHRGVSHWIEHVKPSRCEATRDYSCSMLKPYPKEGDRPMDGMIGAWNRANPLAAP